MTSHDSGEGGLQIRTKLGWEGGSGIWAFCTCLGGFQNLASLGVKAAAVKGRFVI